MLIAKPDENSTEIEVGNIVYLRGTPYQWYVKHIDADIVSVMLETEDEIRTFKRERFISEFLYKQK